MEPSTRCKGQQPAGAEFLERRLQRAQAVPEAERSPDVQAFVESSQLLQRVCELLPLSGGTGGKRPTLPPGPAAYRQLMQAMLAFARASYICPAAPISSAKYGAHLGAYLAPRDQRLDYLRHSSSSGDSASVADSSSNSSGGSGDSAGSTSEAAGLASQGCTPLAELLKCFIQPVISPPMYEDWQVFNDVLTRARSQQQQAAIAAELKQLAAAASPPEQQPLLTASQLLYASYMHISEYALVLRSIDKLPTLLPQMRQAGYSLGQLTPAREAALQAAAEDYGQRLLQLDPERLSSLYLAAQSTPASWHLQREREQQSSMQWLRVHPGLLSIGLKLASSLSVSRSKAVFTPQTAATAVASMPKAVCKNWTLLRPCQPEGAAGVTSGPAADPRPRLPAALGLVVRAVTARNI